MTITGMTIIGMWTEGLFLNFMDMIHALKTDNSILNIILKLIFCVVLRVLLT